MRVSLNWLKDYVDVPVSPDELAEKLTMLGLEIESVERPGAEISNVVVGHILSIEPHPDADKLVVCRTDVGGPEPLQIVCGASNMRVGDKVPTAVVGATLTGGFQITKRKMRGVESHGMMCAADELGLGSDHSGLLILPADLPTGRDAKPFLGLDDVIFEIEVIPNRGDWASMIGVARELAALFKAELRLPEAAVAESGEPAARLSSVTNDAPDLCPRYIGRVLTGVRIAPSPQWLCNRLIAAGMRPINNVVDVTNYVLLETGHPLHAFDYDLLAENRIHVRRARDGEPMKTLDGQSHALSAEMLVIADAGTPQAVAGIMGGEHSEVGEKTTNLFLESAYFDPVSIRRTSRALGLATESSQRFQRGADPEMAAFAIDRAARLIRELAGGTVAPGILDACPAPIPRREVCLRYERNNRYLGTPVPAAEQRQHLIRLGFEPVAEDAVSVTVRVPSWRHDVTQEADLIEEVARLHGYDRIPATLPRVRPVEARLAPEDKPLRALRRFMVRLGLTEVFHWTFTCPEDVRRAGLPEERLNMVTLQNPLSERYTTLRSSLLPGLLANVARNLNRGAQSVATFELGPVYEPADGEDLPQQRNHLGIALCGAATELHWSAPQRAFDFFDLKGLAEEVTSHFQAACTLAPCEDTTFQPGQAAGLVLNGASVGRLGKVHPAILANSDISQDVYLLEMLVDALMTRPPVHAVFAPIPAFPPSRRDLAVLVNRDVPAGELRETAARAGGEFLQSVKLFDVYTGEQVSADKKSVALEFVFQSPERTLTDTDTQKAFDRILRALERTHGAQLR